MRGITRALSQTSASLNEPLDPRITVSPRSKGENSAVSSAPLQIAFDRVAFSRGKLIAD